MKTVAEIKTARLRLSAILEEAGKIIRDNPDLMIDHVTAYKHGVYTVLDIPGVATAPEDPLLDTIKAFREALATFSAIPVDEITYANEDALVEETYGPWMEKLDDWDEPARSVEGAIEAIKHMQNQDVFCDPAGKSMAKAVLAFLEGVRA